MHRKSYNRFESIFPHINEVINEVANTPIKNFKNDVYMSSNPKANVLKFDNHLEIHLALPGFKKDDVKVEINDQTLKISSNSKADETKPFKHQEWGLGSFERIFTLPQESDLSALSATMTAGVLKIEIPKSASFSKSIEIK